MTSGIDFHAAAPAPPLAPFVEFYWLQSGTAPAHARERVLPTATMELVIGLGDQPMRVFEGGARAQVHRGSALCGARVEPFEIDTAPLAGIMGVHFRPGGAAPLLGIDADEIAGRFESFEAIWGRVATELRERLLEAATPQARFALLDAALLERLSRRTAAHPAVGHALDRLGRPASSGTTVGDVIDDVGLSPRHFIDVFRRQVGIAPKQFWRVSRFQDVLRAASTSAPRSWTRLALACGYYDQSHFIRDFRAFAGLTPGEFTALGGAQRNHVVLAR